ncbi:MAG: hypothetical protein RLZZ200_1198 [Pseudomonadota bacterium]|jgi:hypothetical protein
MNGGELREVALTPEEIARILSVCGTRALLVGGQSLAFWALYYEVRPPGVLSESITMDVDFVGTAKVAELLLQGLGEPWKLHAASLDDLSGQTAKVYEVLPGRGLKQIDFLSGIVGLDIPAVTRRAVEVEVDPDVWVRVLHPLDVLESRLQNLRQLPAKQNEIGIAQTRLAVDVVRAFLEDRLADGDKKRVFQAIKRIRKLVLDPWLSRTAFKYSVEVIDAVPVAKIAAAKFREQFWPDLLTRLRAKHTRYAAGRPEPR